MSSILDLSTIVDRKTIVLDGDTYEFRHISEFGLADSQALTAKWKPIATILKKQSATDEQFEQALGAAQSIVAEIVVDLPEDLLGKLTFWHCGQIAGAWFKEARRESEGDEGNPPAED